MYDYKEVTKANVREWMEENREMWESEDRHDAYEIVYDATWVDDSVTGNGSGSFTFSRLEARRNFFEDENSDDYVAEMIEDGFMDKALFAEKIACSDWEWVDVSIRCWLLGACVTEIMDEIFGD